MRKIDVLQLIVSVVKPRDSYQEAEQKIKHALGQKKADGLILGFDMNSDPTSSNHNIYWVTQGTRRFERLTVDVKRIDRDLLTVMEVLDT